MCLVRNDIQQATKWALGVGKIDIWDDIWIGDSTLRSLCPNNAELISRPVRDLWSNGEWDELKIDRILVDKGVPTALIENIKETPFDGSSLDVPRWELASNGNFTVASAWEAARQRGQQFRVFELIWSKGLTPTISVFLWCLLSNRIPVDEKLQWRRISLASRCRCCKAGNVETVQHLFIHGEAASKVWRHYESWFPHRTRRRSLQDSIADRLGIWGGANPNTQKCHIKCLIPCLIMWFLWTERNSCVHRSTTFSPNHVVGNINMHLHNLVISKTIVEEHWQDCRPEVSFMSRTSVRRRLSQATMIRWLRPEPPWIKLNTDGAYNYQSGLAGGGGVVRDHRGDLLHGFTTPLKARSAVEAELLALKQVIGLAALFGKEVWVELDAEYIVDLIISGQGGPARLRHTVQDIRFSLRRIRFKVTHIAREGNKAADYLAQKGIHEEGLQLFNGSSAPSRLKALVGLDKEGVPNFRFHAAGG